MTGPTGSGEASGRDDVDGTSGDGAGPDSVAAYRRRIRELAGRARAERRSFEPPADPPAERRALAYLREGFGPTVMVYVEARTGGRLVRFSQADHDLLGRAVDDWLRLYARCYGVDLDPQATVRTAAEALLETHDLRDTAQVLTRVPDR